MSPADIQAQAQARAARQSGELVLTRERAANWSKGVGALLVVALGFSLVKGRDDLTTLDPAFAAGVGVCLGLGALLAGVSAYHLFRASYGPLSALEDSVTDHTEAKSTMTALARGLGAAVVAFLLLLAAVGLTWYGPPAKDPQIQITDADGKTWCGEPKPIADGVLELKVDGQVEELDLATATRVQALESCEE